jgi:hypothetical protein
VFNTVYQCLIHSYKSFPITGDISTSFYNWEYPFVTIWVPRSFWQEYEKIIFKWESARLSRFSEFINNVNICIYLSIMGLFIQGSPYLFDRFCILTCMPLIGFQRQKSNYDYSLKRFW